MLTSVFEMGGFDEDSFDTLLDIFERFGVTRRVTTETVGEIPLLCARVLLLQMSLFAYQSMLSEYAITSVVQDCFVSYSCLFIAMFKTMYLQSILTNDIIYSYYFLIYPLNSINGYLLFRYRIACCVSICIKYQIYIRLPRFGQYYLNTFSMVLLHLNCCHLIV